MELTVRIKEVYGKELVYPADKTGEAIARVAGKKTFTASDIVTLGRAGFTFKVETPTL